MKNLTLLQMLHTLKVIIRGYYKQPYTNIFDSLGEIDKISWKAKLNKTDTRSSRNLSSLSSVKTLNLILKTISHIKHVFQPQNYEIRNQIVKKDCINTNSWRPNNVLLNNQWVTEEIEEEIKKYLETKWNWKHHDPKSVQCSKSSSEREV